jgi:hypothetical protein
MKRIRGYMQKKFKIILSSIILSISISNANAGLLDFAKEHPLLSAVGIAGGSLYFQTAMHKARDLSYHLPNVESYFQKNPQDFNQIAKYVLNALAHPANKSDYDRYKRLAEVMELDNIPPYNQPNVNSPNVLVNQPQEQNPNNILENPVQQQPFSNIIITPQGEQIDTSTEFPIEPPKTWEEYLLLKQNSQELADNMEQAGMGTKPQGYATHHLVPATDKAAQDARNILTGYGIDINDAVNGVYLPTPKDITATQGIEHNGRHPKYYAQTVNDLIKSADKRGGQQAVLNELNDIKDKLQKAKRDTDWRNVL